MKLNLNNKKEDCEMNENNELKELEEKFRKAIDEICEEYDYTDEERKLVERLVLGLAGMTMTAHIARTTVVEAVKATVMAVLGVGGTVVGFGVSTVTITDATVRLLVSNIRKSINRKKESKKAQEACDRVIKEFNLKYSR